MAAGRISAERVRNFIRVGNMKVAKYDVDFCDRAFGLELTGAVRWNLEKD